MTIANRFLTGGHNLQIFIGFCNLRLLMRSVASGCRSEIAVLCHNILLLCSFFTFVFLDEVTRF